MRMSDILDVGCERRTLKKGIILSLQSLATWKDSVVELRWMRHWVELILGIGNQEFRVDMLSLRNKSPKMELRILFY